MGGRHEWEAGMNGGAGMNGRQANIGGRHEWEAGKNGRQV